MFVLYELHLFIFCSSRHQVKIGRDHTIYAVAPGFVRYYSIPWRRGKARRFVGVVLNRGEKLPRDEGALGRSRYFGLVNLAELEHPHGELVQNTLAEINP